MYICCKGLLVEIWLVHLIYSMCFLVWGSRCPVSSFTNISFIMVDYQSYWIFLPAIPRVATGQNRKQGWAVLFIQLITRTSIFSTDWCVSSAATVHHFLHHHSDTQMNCVTYLCQVLITLHSRDRQIPLFTLRLSSQSFSDWRQSVTHH